MPLNELQVAGSILPAVGNYGDDTDMSLHGTLQAIRRERTNLGLPPYSEEEELQAARHALVSCRLSVEKALAEEYTTVAAELDQACRYHPGISSSSWAGPAAIVGVLASLVTALGCMSFWPLIPAVVFCAAGIKRSMKADSAWRLSCATFGARPSVSAEQLCEARRRTIYAMTNEVRRVLHNLPVNASPEQITAVHRNWYWSALPKDAGDDEGEFVTEELKRCFDSMLRLQMRVMPQSDGETAAFEANCRRAEQAIVDAYRQRLSEAHAAYMAVEKALVKERDAEIERLNRNLLALVATPLRLSQSE